MFASHPIEEYRRGMLEFGSSVPDLVPAFRELDLPVLGLCGADDPYPDKPEVLAGMKGFREAPSIAGAGRFVHWERPQRVQRRRAGVPAVPAGCVSLSSPPLGPFFGRNGQGWLRARAMRAILQTIDFSSRPPYIASIPAGSVLSGQWPPRGDLKRPLLYGIYEEQCAQLSMLMGLICTTGYFKNAPI